MARITTGWSAWCAAVGLALGSVAAGQSTAPKTPANIPPGPSMEETKAWLENEGQLLMKAHGSQDDRRFGALTLTDHYVSGLTLEECVLSWTNHLDAVITVGPTKKVTNTASLVKVPLKDLDTGALTVEKQAVLSDEELARVRIETRAAVGDTISSASEGAAPKLYNSSEPFVRSREDAQRVATAVKRAAILCGAPVSRY